MNREFVGLRGVPPTLLRVAAGVFMVIGIIQVVTFAVERLWPFAVAGAGFIVGAVLLELMARRLRALDRLPIMLDVQYHGPAVGILLIILVVALCFSTLA
ncbi:MAG: hypothetical protein L0G99_09410 [Propionibacteriales bacterium]|nr:hypothetical protein [Propionibacteriales bacterium]